MMMRGKDGFGENDKLTITFETSESAIFKYDLLNDDILVERDGIETIYDDILICLFFLIYQDTEYLLSNFMIY